MRDLPYPSSPSVTERGPLAEAGKPALYYRWAPAVSSKGTVLVLHGMSEHSGRYEHVLDHLAGAGFSALAIDYRGWGLAEGKRACLRSFDEYVTDALRGLRLARHKMGGEGPIFLLGHSQGGLLAARTAMEEGTGLAGLVLSAPALGIGVEVPFYKRAVAALASTLVPDLSLPSDIPNEWLTKDPEMLAWTAADPLMVRKGTARWFTETLRTQALVLSSAASITTPTLFLIAGDERLVSVEANRAFRDRLGCSDPTWIEYPGLLHEVFNELERRTVLEDLVSWLRERTNPDQILAPG